MQMLILDRTHGSCWQSKVNHLAVANWSDCGGRDVAGVIGLAVGISSPRRHGLVNDAPMYQ
jgi:hypothetical protein